MMETKDVQLQGKARLKSNCLLLLQLNKTSVSIQSVCCEPPAICFICLH